MIHSNANLGVHGQGLLNLSGTGDLIEAQRLVLSLFYSIHVSGSFFFVFFFPPDVHYLKLIIVCLLRMFVIIESNDMGKYSSINSINFC